MARTITLTFEDGSQHTYNNVPDSVTPQQVQERARKEFKGKALTNIDGGRPETTAQTIGRNVASLADVGLNMATGALDIAAYPLARAYYGLSMSPEAAAAKAKQETTSPKDIIGGALGITQTPGYQNEASRRALQAVGETVQPYVEPAIQKTAQVTGLPQYDVEALANLIGMAVAPGASRAISRTTRAVAREGAEAARFAGGVAKGITEAGEQSYRTPMSAIAPEIRQQLPTNIQQQQQLIQPGMAGRQLGNELVRSAPMAMAAAGADAMGGAGLFSLANAAQRAKVAKQTLNDIRGSYAQRRAGITSHQLRQEEPTVSGNQVNAVTSGFAQQLDNNMRQPEIVAPVVPENKIIAPVKPEPLRLGYDPESAGKQPFYVTPGGAATKSATLADEAAFRERVGMPFPAGPVAPTKVSGGAQDNFWGAFSKPAVEAPVKPPEIFTTDSANVIAKRATTENVVKNTETLKNIVETNPNLEPFTQTYVIHPSIKEPVDKFLRNETRNVTAYGPPGTGKTSLAYEWKRRNPEGMIDIVDVDSLSGKEYTRKENAAIFGKPILYVIDEADQSTPKKLDLVKNLMDLNAESKLLVTSNDITKVPSMFKTSEFDQINVKPVLTTPEKEAYALSVAKEFKVDRTPEEILNIARRPDMKSFRDIKREVSEGYTNKVTGDDEGGMFMTAFGPQRSVLEQAGMPKGIVDLFDNFVQNKTSKNLMIVQADAFKSIPQLQGLLERWAHMGDRVQLTNTKDYKSLHDAFSQGSIASITKNTVIRNADDAKKLNQLKSALEYSAESTHPTKLIAFDYLNKTSDAIKSRAYIIDAKKVEQAKNTIDKQLPTEFNKALLVEKPDEVSAPVKPEQQVSTVFDDLFTKE